MVGFRSREFYLKKFGDKGEEQYQKVLKGREKRIRLKNSNRKMIIGDNHEKEIAVGNAIRCEACGSVMSRLQWTHFKKCNVSSLVEYKKLYPDALLIAPNLARMAIMSLENMIECYGKEEGQIRWDEYRRKQAVSNTFEYKAEKFGWDEQDFHKYNLKRAVTLENLVQRYGFELGTTKWHAYCNAQAFTNSLEYFIQRERNAEIGLEKWLEYNHAKGSSRRVPDLAERHGISLDEASILLSKTIPSVMFVSEAERVFIEHLEKELGESIKYTHKTRQFCIWSDEANQPFFFDACCTKRNRIIEFNGDYWHARPSTYGPDHMIYPTGKSASEIWSRDQTKRQAAMKRGFEFMVVWESDFINNPDKVSKEVCLWFNS